MKDVAFLFLLLGAMNVVCFLPHYLLNFPERPNPAESLLSRRAAESRGIRLLYTKLPYSDPLRINFDFSVAVFVTVWAGWQGTGAQLALTALFLFGVINVIYVGLMQSVFKRPPVLGSDLSLLKTGLSIMRRWIIQGLIALLVVLGILGLLAFETLAIMLQLNLKGNPIALMAAAALLPSCLLNLFKYDYRLIIYRTVYSPVLHLLRNFEVGREQRRFINEESDYFAGLNQHQPLSLVNPPNIVILCIESYGGVVYRDSDMLSQLQERLDALESQIRASGLHVASVMSVAPLFSGGSWLSYTTFTYGLKVDNVVVHDRLFAPGSGFSAYDSLFHVLGRSGYQNVLLCPLGGVPKSNVDWDAIQRNFQADVMIDFESLAYVGPRLPYLGNHTRYAPLDQYALNAAYTSTRARAQQPFTLFYLTLNSHHPYNSPLTTSADWQSLNTPDTEVCMSAELGSNLRVRFICAMRYQLEMFTRFLADNADDHTVFVVFGDHQPPMVAQEDMGTATPVHVISRHEGLVSAFVAGGYTLGLRPKTSEGALTRHEDFMALMLSAMREQYGQTSSPNLEPAAGKTDSPEDSPKHAS
ncbi:MAG: sulfatase-like hydrolase/transferase [Pseudomonadota bacterium]